jgi:glycosyltransferase involved in cell wall biosynthesis
MPAPLVNVIVPTYNRAHLVGRTIESALRQTYQNLEIVVMDDGSTDDTEAVVRKSYGSEPRVRYFKKENGGPASARNAGIDQACGDYVALLDSDDTWHPWKLDLQIRCMVRFPDVGMTWTDMQMIGPDGQVLHERYLRKMYTAYRLFTDEQIFDRAIPLREIAPDLTDHVGDAKLRTGNIFSKMVMGNLVHTSTVVLRRERLARVKGFNTELRVSGEDFDFHLRTAREGTVGLIDLPTIRYQQGLPDRLTAGRYAVYMAENLVRTIEPMILNERHAIDLPDELLSRKLAEAHAWIASERLKRSEPALARAHYLKSLHYWPWPRPTAFLCHVAIWQRHRPPPRSACDEGVASR